MKNTIKVELHSVEEAAFMFAVMTILSHLGTDTGAKVLKGWLDREHQTFEMKEAMRAQSMLVALAAVSTVQTNSKERIAKCLSEARQSGVQLSFHVITDMKGPDAAATELLKMAREYAETMGLIEPDPTWRTPSFQLNVGGPPN